MIHGGQFAILKTPVELPGYVHVSLSNGWILSHHEKLPVYRSADNSTLLLGIAWQVAPGRGTPVQEIEQLCASHPQGDDRSAILAMEETWCGRYVLIRHATVHTDTCSLLAVFYSDQGISSDCTLLAQAAGQSEKLYSPGPGVMNWMPGPLTHYDGVRRLLASQTYQYTTGEVSARPLLAQHYQTIADEQELVHAFTDLFTNSLRNMTAALGNKKLLIALTGGYDSRSLFAMAHRAGIDFDAYTLEYDTIYADDVDIPRKLCQLTGVKHHYIPVDHARYDAQLEQDYLTHTAGLIRDQDRIFYAHGQYQQLIEKFGEVVFLRSSIWENVIEYFRRSFTETGPGFDFYDWFCVAEGSLEKRSLEQYFAWNTAHPEQGLVASNMFLWLQREGCWLSDIESGFALLDNAISLQPANCRLFLRMLMDFPRDERLMKFHQAKLIRHACPAIGEVPFGSDKIKGETLIDRLIPKIKRGVDRLCKLGIRKTVLTYTSFIRHRISKHKLQKKLDRRS